MSAPRLSLPDLARSYMQARRDHLAAVADARAMAEAATAVSAEALRVLEQQLADRLKAEGVTGIPLDDGAKISRVELTTYKLPPKEDKGGRKRVLAWVRKVSPEIVEESVNAGRFDRLCHTTCKMGRSVPAAAVVDEKVILKVRDPKKGEAGDEEEAEAAE